MSFLCLSVFLVQLVKSTHFLHLCPSCAKLTFGLSLSLSLSLLEPSISRKLLLCVSSGTEKQHEVSFVKNIGSFCFCFKTNITTNKEVSLSKRKTQTKSSSWNSILDIPFQLSPISFASAEPFNLYACKLCVRERESACVCVCVFMQECVPVHSYRRLINVAPQRANSGWVKERLVWRKELIKNSARVLIRI